MSTITTIYTVQVEAANADHVWQPVHPPQTVTAFNGETAEDIARSVAANQTAADGQSWRVQVWIGRDADVGTEPDVAVIQAATTSQPSITADHLRQLRDANFPDSRGRARAVLVQGPFADGDLTVVTDATAENNGYRVLVTAAEMYEAWGDDPMTDAELAQVAQQFNAELATDRR
jgi:hypothetical protein